MLPLLEVEGLEVAMGTLPVVRGVSFGMAPGEILALVGESGSGKSLTALALPGLLPPGARTRGGIRLEGEDLLAMSPARLRAVRGRRIGFLVQEALSAFNPVRSIGSQMREALPGIPRAAADRRIAEGLREVGLAEAVARSHPHTLSGGMRQRALLAMMLLGRPRLLIADEPTTALDRRSVMQLLVLLHRLRRERGMAILLISHDWEVVEGLADRALVFYAGQVVEEGRVADLQRSPRHPYTRALLAAVPRMGHPGALQPLPGRVPSPEDRPRGCPFHPRCDRTGDRCGEEEPSLQEASPDHRVACFHPL